MPIVISPITSPTEIPTIVSIISTTFAHTAPLVDAIYPHHDTPHGSAAAVASLTHEFNTNPSARFLKAVDTETGEVVGQANWLVVNGREGEGEEKEGERGLGEGAWDSLEEREFAELLYGSLMAQRNEFLVLTFLSVLPAHQRRGAGSQLIKLGTDLADSMGLDTILEATKAGIPIYTKHDFLTEFLLQFTYPAKFADRKRPELAFMRRKRRSGADGGSGREKQEQE